MKDYLRFMRVQVNNRCWRLITRRPVWRAAAPVAEMAGYAARAAPHTALLTGVVCETLRVPLLGDRADAELYGDACLAIRLCGIHAAAALLHRETGRRWSGAQDGDRQDIANPQAAGDGTRDLAVRSRQTLFIRLPLHCRGCGNARLATSRPLPLRRLPRSGELGWVPRALRQVRRTQSLGWSKGRVANAFAHLARVAITAHPRRRPLNWTGGLLLCGG